MSCILRISGKNLAVDDLSSNTALKPYRLDRTGDPTRRPGHLWPESCAHFDVSTAGFDALDSQIADATQFLEIHEAELRSLVTFPGVESAVLNFGIAWRDLAAQTDHLPPALLALAGRLGIGIALSHYAMSESEEAGATGA